MARILVVDDEPSLREVLTIALEGDGHDVAQAESVTAALAAWRDASVPFPLVISDLKLPDRSGLDLLAEVKHRAPGTEVIIITAFATVETGIEAMKLGAYDYVIKPFKIEEMRALVTKALEKTRIVEENRTLKAELAGRYQFGSLLGSSPEMRRVLQLLERVADARSTVLIQGPSGTGKELAARALHFNSGRRSRPFIPVNCGAIPENLIESELFGHVKGAFTGAERDQPGLFQSADGGTVFLDEVSELPMAMQVKLLRVLQERTVKPIGGARELSVDVRVIAAANRDLSVMVREGLFREDLFYRLNVIPVFMPPLSERREDIPLLVSHFLRKFARETGGGPYELSLEALEHLMKLEYRGNVRELENIIERAVALASGNRIGLEELPGAYARPTTGEAGSAAFAVPSASQMQRQPIDFKAEVEAFERALLRNALEATRGHKTNAAALLGLKFRALRYLMNKYDFGGADDGDDEN